MLSSLPTSLIYCLFPLLVATQSVAPKRGLVYIGGNKHATGDAEVWHRNTDLTWYYNYARFPVAELASSNLEWVPMYWGEPDEKFLDAISSRKRGGENITHVLGFNEPDMDKDVGGSEMSPSDAAKLWQDQIEPLKELGIKVGAPAVSGSPIGYAWLKAWEKACDGNCNPDFMPIHWYGDFAAFASWVGNVSVTCPNLELWVTEFGLPGANLEATQSFFNQSIAFLDESSNVTRYAYFGSVRSSASNIGSNSAMLNNDGELTDIGSWYLGPNATGVRPENSAASRASSSLPAAQFLCIAAMLLLM